MPSNPYDFNSTNTSTPANDKAVQTPPGILANAMDNAPSVTPATTADKVSDATATGYNAAQATGTNWNVDSNQTVAGQIAKDTSQGSPLWDRAGYGADAEMAQRGLVNSSMAVGARQAAILDKALPIAQQDASTYASAGKYAADVANTTSQFNTNATNAASAQNATEADRASALNAAAQNDATKTDAQFGLQAQLANQDVAVKQAAQKYDTATRIALQNADAATKVQLQDIDANTRVMMSNIEARYHNQMQTSQSMASTYQSMIDNITKVMQDSTLDGPAKGAAIHNLTTLYNNALGMQQNISQLNLGKLLDPNDFMTGGAPGGAAAAAGAADGRKTIEPVGGAAAGDSVGGASGVGPGDGSSGTGVGGANGSGDGSPY